jgi:hypothetical protein
MKKAKEAAAVGGEGDAAGGDAGAADANPAGAEGGANPEPAAEEKPAE